MVQIQPGAPATLASLMQARGGVAPVKTGAEPVVNDVTTDSEATTTIGSEPAATDEASGVLRLLQAGHFRGVADVRLRMVHADRIAAAEAEQTRADVTESSADLTSSVASTVTELAELSDSVSIEEANAAAVAFEDQVEAGIDALFASDEFEVTTFESTLRASFQSLVDKLGLGSPPADDLVTGAVEEPLENDTGAIDAGAASRDFLAELNDIFSVEVANIMAAAETRSLLPPISEASGNGRAFEKFLAAYNEIQYGDKVDDTSPEIEVVA